MESRGRQDFIPGERFRFSLYVRVEIDGGGSDAAVVVRLNVGRKPFLVVAKRFYKRACPSVGPSVGRLVRGHESKSEEMSVLEHF